MILKFAKTHIESTLGKAAGDKICAAEQLGSSLSTLYRTGSVRPVETLLLNMLEIEDQADDSPGGLSLRCLAIAAGLSAEAVAPNRHVARAMAADFGLPVDFPVDLPKRKFAGAD
jgi:hypothetical protein